MSFSQKVKSKFKNAVKFINKFEQTAAELAIEKGYHYVVCGHIHHPEMTTIKTDEGEVVYLNSGDWVESLTALEYHHKEWKIVKYKPSDFKQEEDDLGLFSDTEDLHRKLDIHLLLEKIKLESI